MNAYIFAFIGASILTGLAAANRKSEKKDKIAKYAPLFIISGIVFFLLHTLLTDTNDKTMMFDNIKPGLPPF